MIINSIIKRELLLFQLHKKSSKYIDYLRKKRKLSLLRLLVERGLDKKR